MLKINALEKHKKLNKKLFFIFFLIKNVGNRRKSYQNVR
jgi:hypothetical protein